LLGGERNALSILKLTHFFTCCALHLWVEFRC